MNIEQKVVNLFLKEQPQQGWKQFCMYYEMINHAEYGLVNNSTNVWFDDEMEVIESMVSGATSVAITSCFEELHKTATNSGKPWVTCKVKLTPDGKYSFKYENEDAPRLMKQVSYHPDYENF